MLFKHIDFESNREERLSFKKEKKAKHFVMIGNVPEEVPEEKRYEEPDDTDTIAKQILESLENQGEAEDK